jgi:putative heme transporter
MMERDRPRGELAPRTIRHELSLRSVFSVLAIVGGLWLVVQIWQIILLLIMALILAGTVSPILSWLEHHHLPRAIALSLILVVLVLTIAGVGALVIPALVTQVGALATSAPTIQGRLADYLASVPALAGSAGAVRSVQPNSCSNHSRPRRSPLRAPRHRWSSWG